MGRLHPVNAGQRSTPVKPRTPTLAWPQGFTRSTTKYWVRNEDVSTVKHHVLQHLPVFQFDKNNFAGDAQVGEGAGAQLASAGTTAQLLLLDSSCWAILHVPDLVAAGEGGAWQGT